MTSLKKHFEIYIPIWEQQIEIINRQQIIIAGQDNIKIPRSNRLMLQGI
jgi:hypothetical protein